MNNKKSKTIIIFLLLVMLASTFATMFVLRFLVNDKELSIENQTIYSSDEAVSIFYQYNPCLYHYSLLNDNEKKIYDGIYLAVSNFESSKTFLTSIEPETIFKIYKAIRNDHPEIYWVDGKASINYFEFSGLKKMDLIFNYTLTKEEVINMNCDIDEVVDSIVIEYSSLSEFQIVKSIYEYLSDNIVYNNEPADYDYGIFGALVNGKAVCAGYSKAFQFLLSYFDIDAIYCSGVIENNPEGHAWNLVKLDDEWYQVDVTWGDMELENYNVISYSYLLITDDEMLKDRTYNLDFTYPNCYAVRYNYYYIEDKMLFEYSTKELIEILNERTEYGKPFTFKCSNDDLFSLTYSKLIDNNELWMVLLKAHGDFSKYECMVRSNAPTKTIDIILKYN